MVNVSVHFLAGMAVAGAITLPRVRRAWLSHQPLATPMARWLLLSAALGLLAIAPSLLRRLGIPDTVCDSPIMNLFVFYPLLNHVFHGGTVWGPAALALAFAAHYGLLIFALNRRGDPCHCP